MSSPSTTCPECGFEDCYICTGSMSIALKYKTLTDPQWLADWKYKNINPDNLRNPYEWLMATLTCICSDDKDHNDVECQQKECLACAIIRRNDTDNFTLSQWISYGNKN